jgi:hypothetical protein
MAGIENGSKSDSRFKCLHPIISLSELESGTRQGVRHIHYPVHLIVYNMTRVSEIHRIDGLVVAVPFVTVQILSLPSMPRVVEKQRIIRLRVSNQPVHSRQNILLRRLALRMLLVVGENHHVIPFVVESVVEEAGHVLDIVDATA